MGTRITGILAAVAVAAIGFTSMQAVGATDATVHPVVAYYPIDSVGALDIAGAAGAQFSVWGEQADGGYGVVAYGALNEEGDASLWVPQDGPIDYSPQFVVEVGGSGGGFFAVDDPIHEWWLD